MKQIIFPMRLTGTVELRCPAGGKAKGPVMAAGTYPANEEESLAATFFPRVLG